MLVMQKKQGITEKTEIKDRLLTIYKRLYRHFGPRHWWPAETDLEMILGAILVQNVSWKNTEVALANLRENDLLSIAAICCCEEEHLQGLIKPARFYQTKARKLKAFCRQINSRWEGRLQDFLAQPLFSLRKELLGLYGIGPETADSIILYAARQPIFVVDAYTRRIYQRLGFFPATIGYSEMQEFFMSNLRSGDDEADRQLFNEYHALIDCLGNRLCSNKNPRCGSCPLQEICAYSGKKRSRGVILAPGEHNNIEEV